MNDKSETIDGFSWKFNTYWLLMVIHVYIYIYILYITPAITDIVC